MAKMIKRLTFPMILILALTSASCRNAAPSVNVLRGNLSYGRGQNQKAILDYLSADDAGNLGKDVIYYNLANVYFALGEGDAALRTWSMAENRTDDTDLLFRIAFNRGVLYYHRGHYDEAYRSFRRALILRPGDIDAKVNLEESLSRVRSTAPSQPDAGEEVGGEGDEDRQRLLDYVRRKEADAWTAQDQNSEEHTADW